jgi:peptide/nickel transport system permease protein
MKPNDNKDPRRDAADSGENEAGKLMGKENRPDQGANGAGVNSVERKLEENAEPKNAATGSVAAATTALDDEARVKVLSPTMLVVKRFIRNKLAITGFIILVAMFIFSFLGGFFTPYGESQVFTNYDVMQKEYASAAISTEFRYFSASGKDVDSVFRSKFISAANGGKTEFEYNGVVYSIVREADDFYRITSLSLVGETVMGNVKSITPTGDKTFGEEDTAAVFDAIEKGESRVTASDGVEYSILRKGREYGVYTQADYAVASKLIIDAEDAAEKMSFEFRLAAERALIAGADTVFTADGREYEIDVSEDGAGTVYVINGGEKAVYASVSDFVVKPITNDINLTVEFKKAVRTAVESDAESFIYSNPATGEDEEYYIWRLNNQFTIKRQSSTMVISMYETPSAKHWLGTDQNGMDILTRLMFGGRISLTIGFVVVILEIIVGVLLGGISGYFSGMIDTVIMRIVDIINCIPTYPLYIIAGAVMDAQKVDPKIRIYYLMLILGVLGWTGVARLVRGQILSLREQEFMIATEATGIPVSRRIFRHLVPNIIPQLIVVATMSLGSIILTEATLSFLGLGVKFPYASWGNIINAVSNSFVMVNYWFVWIPAGFLILLTVLGFNFVGDGLRDAFDPKMIR